MSPLPSSVPAIPGVPGGQLPLAGLPADAADAMEAPGAQGAAPGGLTADFSLLLELTTAAGLVAPISGPAPTLRGPAAPWPAPEAPVNPATDRTAQELMAAIAGVMPGAAADPLDEPMTCGLAATGESNPGKTAGRAAAPMPEAAAMTAPRLERRGVASGEATTPINPGPNNPAGVRTMSPSAVRAADGLAGCSAPAGPTVAGIPYAPAPVQAAGGATASAVVSAGGGSEAASAREPVTTVASAAKVAASAGDDEAPVSDSVSAPEKLFLNPPMQRLAESVARAGIGSAYGGIAMRPTPTAETADPLTPTDAGLAFSERGVGAVPSEAKTAAESVAAEVRPPARQAVEAVLRVVAAQADRANQRPQAVDLHLDLGGEHLRVRVEMRAGDVHTVFRTDSAVLLGALRDEWQVLIADTAGRSWRLADPEFTGTRDGGEAGGQAGDHGGGHPAREHPVMSAAPARSRESHGATVGPAAPASADHPHSLHLAVLA